LFKTQSVPRGKAIFILFIKTDQFMLFGANVAICFEINTKQINRVWQSA